MESIKTVAQKSSRNGGINLKVIFNRIDLDKNGTVHRNGFYQPLNIVGVSLSKEESDLVFDTYGNIGILDLVENTVQIVLRPTNELVEIVFENKGKAAAFAHEIHGLIQRSERKV